jgi:hypothetical protein
MTQVVAIQEEAERWNELLGAVVSQVPSIMFAENLWGIKGEQAVLS